MNTPPPPLISHYLSAPKLGPACRTLDLPHAWQILTQDLALISMTHCFRVQALVLRPDRFDLLFLSPTSGVRAALREFFRSLNYEMTRVRLGRGYGPKTDPTRVGSLPHAKFVYKYLYRGPVRAKLAERPETYPYSTLAGLCGRAHLPLPMAVDEFLFTPDFDFAILEWLNTPSASEHRGGEIESVNVC